MTSIYGSRPRQVSSDTGYYVPLADLRGSILSYNGSAFSTATWAATASGNAKVLPLISSPGSGILKDMGKTVVSASRTFRKVQLVMSTPSTFGVNGQQGTSNGEDYLTGYIELGFEGFGSPSKVAAFGR